ncbi:MAG: DUF975 family protein [Enterococcus sp.]
MKKNRELRAQAREALAGQWGINVGVLFVSFLLSGMIIGVFSGLTDFSVGSLQDNILQFLITNLFTFAFTYATYYIALQVIRGERAQIKQIFTIFDNQLYFPIFAINLVNSLVTYLIGLLVFLPILITAGLGVYLSFVLGGDGGSAGLSNYLVAGNFVFIGSLLVISLIATFVISIFTGIFQFAAWSKMDFPELTVFQSIKEGWRLFKGRIIQYLLLHLSFIGWYILGGMALMIGLFWVVVYNNTSIAAFYDEARKDIGGPVV